MWQWTVAVKKDLHKEGEPARPAVVESLRRY